MGCHAAVVLGALLFGVGSVAAQSPPDSLRFEERIKAARPEATFAEGARSLLLALLRSGDAAEAVLLIRFVDRRSGVPPGWLSGIERLHARVLTVDTSWLRDTARVERELRSAVADLSGRSGLYDDDFLERERALLRGIAANPTAQLDRYDPTSEERHFFVLVVNRLTGTGLRARAELNDMAAEFEERFPASPYRPLVRRYIVTEYREAVYGAGFSVGYVMGSFLGDIRERFDFLHAPWISAEVYLGRLTVVGTLLVGRANVPEAFTAGSDFWDRGSVSMIQASLDAGYEFRWERLAVTPVGGVAVQSLRGGGDGVEDDLPRTQNRLGFQAAGILGYRIPSDVGPHIDLRARVALTAPALSDYDEGFSGVSWSVGIGFALVVRPLAGK